MRLYSCLWSGYPCWYSLNSAREFPSQKPCAKCISSNSVLVHLGIFVVATVLVTDTYILLFLNYLLSTICQLGAPVKRSQYMPQRKRIWVKKTKTFSAPVDLPNSLLKYCTRGLHTHIETHIKTTNSWTYANSTGTAVKSIYEIRPSYIWVEIHSEQGRLDCYRQTIRPSNVLPTLLSAWVSADYTDMTTGVHTRSFVEFCPLRYNTVVSVKSRPTFRRNVSFTSSRLKSEPSKKPG
jgi:hypothetical protein